jgi:hypothetical protein
MGLRCVTARVYLDTEEPVGEVLNEIFTTYASGLIDPDEREEILQQVWGIQVVDDQPALPEDVESIVDES